MGDLTQRPKRAESYSGSFLRKMCNFTRNEEGVAALEFALLAPLLIFALVATADLALAISERMTIDHILRAAAQRATDHVDISEVDQILRTTAAKNMTVATAGNVGDDTSLALNVSRICTCAEQPSLPVACSTTCADDLPTQIYYVFSGDKTYSGLIIPQFSLSKTLQVQIR